MAKIYPEEEGYLELVHTNWQMFLNSKSLLQIWNVMTMKANEIAVFVKSKSEVS